MDDSRKRAREDASGMSKIATVLSNLVKREYKIDKNDWVRIQNGWQCRVDRFTVTAFDGKKQKCTVKPADQNDEIYMKLLRLCEASMNMSEAEKNDMFNQDSHILEKKNEKKMEENFGGFEKKMEDDIQELKSIVEDFLEYTARPALQALVGSRPSEPFLVRDCYGWLRRVLPRSPYLRGVNEPPPAKLDYLRSCSLSEGLGTKENREAYVRLLGIVRSCYPGDSRYGEQMDPLGVDVDVIDSDAAVRILYGLILKNAKVSDVKKLKNTYGCEPIANSMDFDLRGESKWLTPNHVHIWIGELKMGKISYNNTRPSKQLQHGWMRLQLRCAALAWGVHLLNTHDLEFKQNPLHATIEGRMYVRKKFTAHFPQLPQRPEYISGPNGIKWDIQVHGI